MSGDERAEAVLHDAAACYRFVKATAAAAKTASGFPSYTASTQKLIEAVNSLSGATLDYLAGFPSDVPEEKEAFRKRRGLLWLIRSTWRNLHFFVKPAVSADTLNVPTELVELLTHRVRLIEGCDAVEFAVVHTDRLNYFHFPAGDFEQEATSLAEIIHSKNRFPRDLGIIALPHSQSQHLFLNVLLAHEIGHFIFSRLNSIERLRGQIDSALKAAFAPPGDIGLDANLRGSLPEVLQDWAEELFCDLFGVYLLGPSYVFASIEFFDLGNLWNPDDVIDTTAGASHFKFEWKHPAGLFRLWRQSELLDRLGWWQLIQNVPSHYIRLIDESRKMRASNFVFEKIPSPIGTNAINAFCRCLESIEGEASGLTNKYRDENGHALEIEEFRDIGSIVEKYLSHAIVPSTLRFRGKFWSPSALVLLNAAHLFYLCGIKNLASTSDEKGLSELGKRDVWMERTERWTTKGLEDIAMSGGGGE